MTSSDLELKVMATMLSELNYLQGDEDAIRRVLTWLAERVLKKGDPVFGEKNASKLNVGGFDRLAKISNDKFVFSVRDLKAKNQADATKRLIYSAIYLYCKVSGQPAASRKSILNPILEQWRLMDGNTRSFIAADRGLIRNDDMIELDVHATEDAERFISEMNNPDIVGTWKPGGKKANKSKLKV